MIVTRIAIENESKYQENVKHHHSTQQSHKNIFRNIQGMQQYWFTLYPSCSGKIAEKNSYNIYGGRKNIIERTPTNST